MQKKRCPEVGGGGGENVECMGVPQIPLADRTTIYMRVSSDEFRY